MLFAVRCLTSLVVRCALVVIRYVFDVRCAMFVVRDLLCVAYCCLLLVVVVRGLSSVVVSFVVCRWLVLLYVGVCCLLMVVVVGYLLLLR